MFDPPCGLSSRPSRGTGSSHCLGPRFRFRFRFRVACFCSVQHRLGAVSIWRCRSRCSSLILAHESCCLWDCRVVSGGSGHRCELGLRLLLRIDRSLGVFLFRLKCFTSLLFPECSSHFCNLWSRICLGIRPTHPPVVTLGRRGQGRWWR